MTTPVLYEAVFRLPTDRAWELLKDPVVMARAMMISVVGRGYEMTRAEANLTWRAGGRGSDETNEVIVRTTVPIDDSVRLGPWRPVSPVTEVKLDWEPGDQVYFHLTGNPSARPGPILEPALQEQWLRRYCGQAMEIDQLSITHRAPVRSATRNAVFCRADFTGLGVVADPEALAGLLVQGVGRHKSYGFGLLRLAPLTAEASAAPVRSGTRELVGAGR
jgi:hypothetical protein